MKPQYPTIPRNVLAASIGLAILTVGLVALAQPSAACYPNCDSGPKVQYCPFAIVASVGADQGKPSEPGASDSGGSSEEPSSSSQED